MICQQCLHRAATAGPATSSAFSGTWRSGRARIGWVSSRRPLTSSASSRQQAIATATVAQAKGQQSSDGISPGPPTATSTSAAQPFSTPLTPSPQAAGVSGAKRSKKAIRSSAPAGLPLRGINYMKNQDDPVALPDAEYPSWLWTCLEPKPGKDGADGNAGSKESAATAKLTKAARKAAKRRGASLDANAEPAEPDVPLTEQSIDLPSNAEQTLGGAHQAVEARHKLTKALREKRRAVIKEANFLKSMK